MQRHLVRERDEELPLVFRDKGGIGRQELEDRHHGLPGLFTDSFAVALDKLEAEGQCIGILARGRQCLGELKLQVRVVGLAASAVRAASTPPTCPA